MSCVLDLSRERLRKKMGVCSPGEKPGLEMFVSTSMDETEGREGDREETNGARCEALEPHEEGPAEMQAIRKSIRQCGVMGLQERINEAEEDLVMSGGPQGTQWGAKEEVCWGASH